MKNIFKKSLFIVIGCLVANFVWGADVTFTMSDYFTGSNTSATTSTPAAATLATTTSKGNAATGKLGSTNNYFEVVLTTETFTAASISGYINTVQTTNQDWGFQFSTDKGTTWETVQRQANDGNKTEHTIAVNATIPAGANGIRVIRLAGTGTYVTSITLTLASSGQEKSKDATLKKISYMFNGENYALEGLPDKKDHEVILPYGTKVSDITNFAYDPTSPKVKSKTDDFAKVVGEVTALPFTVTINITAEDEETTEKYTVTFKEAEPEKSKDATLKSLSVEGYDIEFETTTTTYNVELPEGSTINSLPQITYEKNDEKASVKESSPTELPGTYSIEVTAEDGKTQITYKINFTVEGGEPIKDSDATLKSLSVDGQAVPNFSPSTTEYNVEYDCTIKKLPEVAGVANSDKAQKVEYVQVTNGVPGKATVTVTAENGDQKVYTINFTCKEEQQSYDPATGVTISPSSSQKIPVGGTVQLTATVSPATANQKVTWSSNKPEYATVDETGLVTGIAKGTATIRATSADGKKYKELSVTVEVVKPSSVKLDPESATISKGETLQMKFTVEPASLQETAEIKWESTKTDVATVDSKGLVTGVALGETDIKITVTAGGSSKNTKAKITVTAPVDDPNPSAGKDLKVHEPDIYEAKSGYNTTLVKYDNQYYEVYYVTRDSEGKKLSVATKATDKNNGITTNDSETKTAAKDGWFTLEADNKTSEEKEATATDEFEGVVRRANMRSSALILKVKGFDQVSFYGGDNSDKASGPLFAVYIDGKKREMTQSKTPTIRRFDITPQEEHLIKLQGFGTSDNRLTAFSLRESQTPRVRYVEGDTAKQSVRITEKLMPIRYFIKNSTITGKTVKTELSWADDKAPAGINLSFNAKKDTAILSGTATCAAGQYRYYLTTTLDGTETSRETGVFTVYSDLKANTDTLVDAYVGENMEEIELRYFALDASAIHIKWEKDLVPEGLTFNDDKVHHTYTMSGALTASAGSYRFIITIDGNADIRITGSIDVIKQELGVNPILFLYKDKALRKEGSDDVTDAVFTHLQSKSFNVKARRTLNALRSEGFYKQFKAIIISEDVNADNEEVLDILRGKVNLPILNMQGFTYPRVTSIGWGEPDRGTLDTLTKNGSNIYIQRGEHPIFSKFEKKSTGTKINILNFDKLKEDGTNSVMPITVTFQGTYCLATAYTRNMNAEYKPAEAYYKDGERQTIIHEIPASVRGKGTGKYICFPLSQKSTKYLTSDGKQLFESIMAYLLSDETVSLKQPSLQINSFSIDGVKAEIDEDNSTIDLTMDTIRYHKLDSLRKAAPEITLADPGMTYVRPASEDTISLQYSMLAPYEFVVSDYIRRRVYEFTLHLTYPQGVEEAYVVGEWVNVYDIYGRKVATTNENIYTLSLPRGIYIAVTARGQTIKILR